MNNQFLDGTVFNSVESRAGENTMGSTSVDSLCPTNFYKCVGSVTQRTCSVNHIVVKDAGLATYQQVAEQIDRQEAERLSNTNLLFNRKADIKITSSGAIGYTRKLFDGVSDNLAWTQVGDMDKYIELDLTKVKPTFTKVIVNGWHLEDAKLILKNGEEAVAVVADEQTEEFCKTFVLKQPVTADALRLEFTQKRVELYEISLY